MDFELQDLMDWFEENKDWLLVPAIVNIAVVLIGFILVLITAGDVHFLIKTIFVLLIFGAPFLGYFLGDYMDPYLEPVFSKLEDSIGNLMNK